MPKVEVDGAEIEVPQGATVLIAICDRLGLDHVALEAAE
jgi:NADH dehydrogenase/NADH:ubiquinone oxidoreductase subunit G